VLIQVLCVPECRNCQPAFDRVRQVLRSEGVDACVEELLVAEEAAARSLHFPGSPTVRVNGVDVEPSGQSAFGLACRLYADGTGLPPEQALRRAISAAREQR
jgi:hypothetical protein